MDMSLLKKDFPILKGTVLNSLLVPSILFNKFFQKFFWGLTNEQIIRVTIPKGVKNHWIVLNFLPYDTIEIGYDGTKIY